MKTETNKYARDNAYKKYKSEFVRKKYKVKS